MSTVPFPKISRTARPAILPGVEHIPQGFRLDAGRVNLTTYRITKTHHGRTLQMLGHAAEYLVHSRQFVETGSGARAHDEAVRILRRLSSSVFCEYADTMKARRPVGDFVVGCANWLFE
jgi:hypothetical protein